MALSPRPSRQRRLDYRLLNDGSDEEATFDRIQELPAVSDPFPLDYLTVDASDSEIEIRPSQSQDPTSPQSTIGHG
ncbi:hypothetical protein V1515DRAFT_595775 [Lipomyces mesembrius]